MRLRTDKTVVDVLIITCINIINIIFISTIFITHVLSAII